ncbi:MAG: magnesium/cobalt transporter CorA [Candidatus Margulisbacteria bacterium]|nr:magnesium/cobalt transporter CorA [Candidatus Margulisiibacteriota bacterium]MBU1617368.1 magnesium/cobalt transporter CorA [Candidatus Margulisiibacteriota bacterium]
MERDLYFNWLICYYSGMKSVQITAFDYNEKHFVEKDIPLNTCVIYKNKPTVTWINIDSIHDHKAVKNICDCFGLAPAVYEQIIDPTQRPKIEDYGKYLFIVLKMFLYNKVTLKVADEQVSFIIGPTYVISFQERALKEDVFDPVRKRLRTAGSKIRQSRADYLAYRLIDAVIDYYFVILEIMGDQIEEIEKETIANPSKKTLVQMQKKRKEMLFFRRSIWPVREIMNSLQRGESKLISPATQKYMRGLYEHAIQIIDTIETERDTMSSMLDIYLSSLSNKLNEVMKILTMISTIFMPLTFITGIYGMNFRHMPELEWRYGYYMVWGLTISIVVSMFVYYKKKKWF